jgi:hypothetical protein
VLGPILVLTLGPPLVLAFASALTVASISAFVLFFGLLPAIILGVPLFGSAIFISAVVKFTRKRMAGNYEQGSAASVPGDGNIPAGPSTREVQLTIDPINALSNYSSIVDLSNGMELEDSTYDTDGRDYSSDKISSVSSEESDIDLLTEKLRRQVSEWWKSEKSRGDSRIANTKYVFTMEDTP